MSSEDDSAAVVMCMRVDMLADPVEGSTKKVCVECGHATWLSPATAKLVKQYNAEVICVICIGHTFGDGDDIVVQNLNCEQMAELKENVR